MPDANTITRPAPEVSDAETASQPPKLFHVVMLNDDYTPMEFVVESLVRFFGHSESAATEIMLHVHNLGRAVCGTFPRDIAETKVSQVENEARRHEHPLKCAVEPEAS